MKHFILTTIAVGMLTASLSSAFAAPSDFKLNSSKGVAKFFEDQGARGNLMTSGPPLSAARSASSSRKPSADD